MHSGIDRQEAFESSEHPVVLLAATVWWPLSARLAIRFVEYGCRVSAICPKGHFLRYVEGLDEILPYRRLKSIKSLEIAIRATKPDIVIPCDDRVVWQLHELHRLRPDLRALIETSLGASPGFDTVECRDLLLETARLLGIAVPQTKRVAGEADVHQWFTGGEQSAVLKVDGTWGGEGVIIARSEEQAMEGFRRLSQPVGFFLAIKRLLINGDPVSLWSWRKQGHPIVTIQRLIDGRPANSMLACWKGEILAMVSVEVIATQSTTGAALLVRIIDNETMNNAARLLVQKLQLSGFCGLDYVIDRSTGLPYLIEMNPRSTQLGHLPLAGGIDLAGALCARLAGRACITSAAPVEGQVIAFFPQAERWLAQRPKKEGIYVDFPQGQPKLARELLRPSWPQRQWISRVYHLFSRPRTVAPVEFFAESSERD